MEERLILIQSLLLVPFLGGEFIPCPLETHKASLPQQELTASQRRDRPLRVSWGSLAGTSLGLCLGSCPALAVSLVPDGSNRTPRGESFSGVASPAFKCQLVTYTCVTLAIPFLSLARPQFPHLQNGTVPRANS